MLRCPRKNEYGQEFIYAEKPGIKYVEQNNGTKEAFRTVNIDPDLYGYTDCILLKHGTIEKFIGRKLNLFDEPVEIK